MVRVLQLGRVVARCQASPSSSRAVPLAAAARVTVSLLPT
ncbi:hypothetical protein SAMN04487976_10457 [Xaviernesmea oryzae]|nr:hypothetical protein SAMN04487976_10457 [Xaviernesmea oryzae]